MNTIVKYELLCVDTKGSTGFSKEEKLIMNLLSREELYLNAIHKKSSGVHSLVDSSANLITTISLFDAKQESLISNGETFLLTVSGAFEYLAPFRHKILMYLQRLKFEDIYILTDDVSAEIACKIYPGINKIENHLRKFLLKFFVTKYGEQWWSMTAGPSLDNKAKSHKDNEKIFSKLTRNHIYSIEFGDLGKIIYASSSGYNEKENIVKELMQIKSMDDVQRLQLEVQNNQIKFFQETFAKKGFKNYWQNLEQIRHKVAHNNLFVTEDLEAADELLKSLSNILIDAESELDSLVFEVILPIIPPDYGELNSHETTDDDKVVMSDKIFLEKLTEVESEYRPKKWDIGLKRFVTTMLGLKENEFILGYQSAKSLKDSGAIEFERIENKHKVLVTNIFTAGSNKPN